MARKAQKPKTTARSVVVFPIRVAGDVWERFKTRSRIEDRSAHSLLIEFVEQYAEGKPKRTWTRR